MEWVDYLSLWGVKLIGLGAILLFLGHLWLWIFERTVRALDMQWSFIQWYAEKRYRINLKKNKKNEIQGERIKD